MNSINKFLFFNTEFKKFFSLILYFLLIILILYPSNILLTGALQLLPVNNPFYKYLGSNDGMFAFPSALFLIFYLIYYFIDKKLYFNENSKYLYLFVGFFILFLIISFTLIKDSFIWLEPTAASQDYDYIKPSVDVRVLKNIFNICLLIFFIITMSNLKFKNNFFLYKLYNFILCYICILNLFSLILYYNNQTYYFSPEGYMSSLLNAYITHYMDYFPYVVYMSLALDIYFFNKDKFLIFIFLIVKIFWATAVNIYSTELLGEVTNKGLFISIIFFLICASLFKLFKNVITKNTIFMSIILINLIYLIFIISPYSSLEPSLKDRAQIFFYFFQDINIFNIFFPLPLKYNFQHNLHNDFWDLYFVFGFLVLIFYNFISKILYLIFRKNSYSFLVLFSIFCVGSLVQNNLLNIYTIINFSFIICLIQINNNLVDNSH